MPTLTPVDYDPFAPALARDGPGSPEFGLGASRRETANDNVEHGFGVRVRARS